MSTNPSFPREKGVKPCNIKIKDRRSDPLLCDKLEIIALLLLYLSQNTFYYKCSCYKGSYKGIVV